jgi:molecular chaperone HscB
MSLCWSCERDAGAALSCAHCGALTAPVAGESFFAVLGLPERYAVDLEAADAAFKERTRLVHPDRFARADPRARQIALRRTVELNEAWRTIKHPVRRAEYLMRLQGYDLAGEGGPTGPTGPGPTGAGPSPPVGADPGRVRLTVSPALLNDVLELREALLEARAAKDAAAARRLGAEVAERLRGALADVARGLEADRPREGLGGDHPGDLVRAVDFAAEKKEKLDTVATKLIAIRYYQRFLEELDASGPEDEPSAASGGGVSADRGSP